MSKKTVFSLIILLFISPIIASAQTTPTVAISMSNASIPVGSTYTVTWSSSDATSCDVVRNSSADICLNGADKCALSNTRTFTASAVGSHSYTVTCSNAASNASQSVDYSVVPAGGITTTTTAATSTGFGIAHVMCPTGYYMLLNGECTPGTATALSSSQTTPIAGCTTGFYQVSAPSSDPCAYYVPSATTSPSTVGSAVTPLTVSLSIDTLPMYENTEHTLTWGSTGATSCDVIHDSPEAGVLSAAPYVDICPKGPNTCSTAANYSAAFTASGNGGSHYFTIICTNGETSASQTVNYSVLPLSASASGFSANPVYGNVPLNVTFQASGGASIDFGDGTQSSATPTQRNVTHWYDTAGTYTATSDGQSITITVSGSRQIMCNTGSGATMAYSVSLAPGAGPMACPSPTPVQQPGSPPSPHQQQGSPGTATSTSAEAGTVSQVASSGAVGATTLPQLTSILVSLESILAGMAK